jgi:hypothetical protein
VYLLHQSVKKPSANGPEVLEFTVNFIQGRPR